MVTLLHILSYAGGLVGFLFVTLSLASGLLWLAELIEEHSKYAKVVGMRSIYVIIGIHVLLLIFDRLPFFPIVFSIIAHLVYLTNFSPTWPFISLTSPKFIASCVLVIADHFTWFFHFAAKAQEAKRYRSPSYRNYGSKNGAGAGDAPTFMDVAAFFGICVWFIPLFLFLSLSANDNALPSNLASAPPSPSMNAIDLSSPNHTPVGESKQNTLARQVSARLRYAPRTSLLKVALEPFANLLPRLRRARKRDDEGLLSPRVKTPIRGSPLHSPVAVPNSYFPWAPDDSSSAGASGSSYGNSLGVDPSRMRPGSPGLGIRRPSPGPGGAGHPGPPRRVQSEAQVTGGGANPRGLATRNGKPAIPDGALGEPDDMVLPPSLSTGITTSSDGPPRMGLGPRGNEPIGDREVLESKRKLD